MLQHVTGIVAMVRKYGVLEGTAIYEDADGNLIDGKTRRQIESLHADIKFPVVRLGKMTPEERLKMRVGLNAVRKHMTESQIAAAVAIAYKDDLADKPGRPKKNCPPEGNITREGLAREFDLSKSLLDAAIHVQRMAPAELDAVFDPEKPVEITPIYDRLIDAAKARSLGVANADDVWITPPGIVGPMHDVFEGDWLDAFTLASNPINAPNGPDGKPLIYTEQNSAFDNPGYPRMWANLPFSLLERGLRWVEEQRAKGHQLYALIGAYIDRDYVRRAMDAATDFIVLDGRVAYGKVGTGGKITFDKGARFPTIILGCNISTKLLRDRGVVGNVYSGADGITQAEHDAWIERQRADNEEWLAEEAANAWTPEMHADLQAILESEAAA
jgi:hypothetical protein